MSEDYLRKVHALRKSIVANIQFGNVPHYMHEGVTQYILNGVAPGNFLTAVLSNNLVDAYKYADGSNRICMEQWARLLYNELPSCLWGSIRTVQDWSELCEKIRKEGEQK